MDNWAEQEQFSAWDYIQECFWETVPRWEAGESLISNLFPHVRWVLALGAIVTAGTVDLTTTFRILLWVAAALLLLYSPYAVRRKSHLREVGLQKQLERIHDQRASLEVIAQFFRDDMYLDVTNHGEQGELEAQIEFLDGWYSVHGIVQPSNPYVGYWQAAAGDRARLKEGMRDKLMIGRVEKRYPFASFQMIFFDRALGSRQTYGTTSWLWPDPQRQTPPPRFVFRVTISSYPKMERGPFIRDYLVEGLGRGEGVRFAELAALSPIAGTAS